VKWCLEENVWPVSFAIPSTLLLFSPLTIRSVQAKNRIMMSAMCQYSAQDGVANAWHDQHYVSRAVGQAGLITIEMTAVVPEGRITRGCLGLWNDQQAEALVRITRQVRAQGSLCGIQLAHAGRKGELFDVGLEAPSAIGFAPDWPEPRAMSQSRIAEIVEAFARAAVRADQAGFDYIEIHAAHGYLINQFLSQLTNKRNDAYGIDRLRLLREIIKAVRASWPDHKPIFVKVSAKERDAGGDGPEHVSDWLLEFNGMVDLVIASAGALAPTSGIPVDVFFGYQIPLADMLKRKTGMLTAAVGCMHDPHLAEQTLAAGSADVVAIGRQFLRDPYWPLSAARQLNADIPWPKPYHKAKADWLGNSDTKIAND
jgi:NADPH2 dehydrogenase